MLKWRKTIRLISDRFIEVLKITFTSQNSGFLCSTYMWRLPRILLYQNVKMSVKTSSLWLIMTIIVLFLRSNKCAGSLTTQLWSLYVQSKHWEPPILHNFLISDWHWIQVNNLPTTPDVNSTNGLFYTVAHFHFFTMEKRMTHAW